MTPFFTILTNYGKTALTEALAAQKPLEIPHMAVGDGGGEYYEPVEEQTNLRNERWRGDLNDLRTDEELQGQVIAEAIIPHGIDGDWTAREIGLFDGKGGLVAVGKYPETYIPSALSGAKSQVYINIIIKVDNVAAVQLIVNHDQVLASKAHVSKTVHEFKDEFQRGDGSLIGIGPLGTLKDIVNWVTLEQFGADPTGEYNSLQQIQNAFIYAKENDLKVIQASGVFKLSGEGDVIISTDTDFTGAVFQPNDWSGSFIVKRKNNWVNYDGNSEIVKLIKLSKTLKKGICNIPLLTNNTTLDDSYIIINSSQPMYYYRNAIRYRKELNQVLSKGQLLAPLYYDFDTTTITNLSALKMERTFLEFNGLSIDESQQETGFTFIQVNDSSKVRINDLSFHSRGEFKSAPSDRVSVSKSAYIYINGNLCSDTSASSSNGATYTIYCGDTLEFHVTDTTSEGYGWGAIGCNDVRRVSFNGCSVSRIDFHNPVMEYLRIQNTNIGNWGLLLSCMGDVYLDKVKFIQRDAYNNSGFIRGRQDVGGWCDGNLYANDITIEGHYDANVADKGLISSTSTNAIKELPAGSPIANVMFKEIYIDGLQVSRDYDDKDVRLWVSYSNPQVIPPKIINCRNVSSNGRLTISTLDTTIQSTMTLKLKDSTFNDFVIRSNKGATFVDATLDDVSSNASSGVTLYLQSEGNYRVTKSVVNKLDGFFQDWNLNRNVLITNCEINAVNSSDFLRLTNQGSVKITNNRIHFSQKTFTEATDSIQKIVGYTQFFDNDIYVDGMNVAGIPVPASFRLIKNKATRFKLFLNSSNNTHIIDVAYNNEKANYSNLVTINNDTQNPTVTIANTMTNRFLI